MLSCQVDTHAPNAKQLLEQVTGAGGSPAGFLFGGLTTALGLRSTLLHLGQDLSGQLRILDFGCGSGRVTRWFKDLHPQSEIFGVDINPDAIAWCKANIPFATFDVGPTRPRLPYADESFDVIIAISVFTHLDMDFQWAWLDELKRILRPGGRLLASLQTDHTARSVLTAERYSQFLESGFLYLTADDRASVEGLPDFYQITYHSRSYLLREWSRWFSVDAIVEHGPFYRQGLAVLRKAPGTGQPELIQLPLACIGTPEAASKLKRSEVFLDGWCFDPDGNSVELAYAVNGGEWQSLPHDILRPDVSAYFGVICPDDRVGFRVALDLPLFHRGFHHVWLVDRRFPIPLSATFFEASPGAVRHVLDRLVRAASASSSR